MIKKLHLGVYGAIIKDDKILLIKKARGPYTEKLDLPGGKIEHGENINDCLTREIKEETGLAVDNFAIINNFTWNINFKNEEGNIFMHHVGLVYRANIINYEQLDEQIKFEDTAGCQFYPIRDLDEEELSPFAKFTINHLKNEIKNAI
ncbi:MAG: NUDIX domain-containing protein [bacterium]|nr:NUDIX domain-containing protein [bacterium]